MNQTQHDVETQLITLTQQFLSESGSELAQRQVSLDASLQHHFGIDSISRAELFQRIEKHFDVEFSDATIAESDTLNDIIKAIQTASPAKRIYHPTEQQKKLDKSHIDPSHANTLVDVLLLYAKNDPNRPHVYLQDDEGKEEIITYGKLFENASRVAHSLLNLGLKPGDTVAIMQPTNPGFFYTFFGALLINCIPVPIYPPFRPHQIEAYAKQEAKILQNAEVRVLVTFHEAENLSKLLRPFIPSLKEVTTVNKLLKNTVEPSLIEVQPADSAMIQYTSGSTSAPKGVLLTHANLLANIRAYGQAIAITPLDVAVSWAPLYHDLGLIGMWLGSMYYGIPLSLMSPLSFLNRPERWLWAIHHHRGTISGGPNFAYELCIRKIEPAQIEGLDLSSWRLAFNGAEPIQPKTLARFSEKFAPYGFKHEAHLPVYGLAESSVCVAISPLNRGPRIDKIDRKIFEEQLQAVPTTDAHGLEFVACGKVIPNHEVKIVGENNQELPDRHVGILYFKGPSSMQGYYRNPEATSAIFHDGWWATGDLAYIADEEIFITGRKKDMIIKAGRNLYPAEIEEITAQIAEIRKGCVIAFGTTDSKRGTEKLIIVAETRDKKPAHPEKIVAAIIDKITSALDIAPDKIVLVPPQTVPKTSSGKLQRAACKSAYLTGTLKKVRVPMWWQITKIGLNAFWAKTRNLLIDACRFIYTVYAVLLMGLSLIPILICLYTLPRSALARVCKFWARSLFFLVGCPIKITGEAYLYQQKPLIFTANHESYIDGLALLSVLPAGTRFIGKKELLNSWLLRTFMRKLNFIAVDREDMPQGLDDARQMENDVRNGSSLLIFPEGTFGYATGLRSFKLGAFKIAAETNTPVCPISINGTRKVLRDNERLFRRSAITITASEPISPTGKEWADMNDLKNKVRAQIEKDHV